LGSATPNFSVFDAVICGANTAKLGTRCRVRGTDPPNPDIRRQAMQIRPSGLAT
jgi:hypothetical protein